MLMNKMIATAFLNGQEVRFFFSTKITHHVMLWAQTELRMREKDDKKNITGDFINENNNNRSGKTKRKKNVIIFH